MAARGGAGVMAAAGVAGWFGFNAVMGFYIYLSRNSPRHPDFIGGRIAPMYYRHTDIFFVELWEKRLAFYGLFLSLTLLILAVAAGALFYRDRFRTMRGLGAFNAAAAAIFLAFLLYRFWPIP